MLGAVKGNDEACIVQSNPTKAKNLLYFKKRLSFSFSFYRMIVRKLCSLRAKMVLQSKGRRTTTYSTIRQDSKRIVVARKELVVHATACVEDNKVPSFPNNQKSRLGYSRKNSHPHDGGHAGKYHGRWALTAVEIQMGGGL